MTKSYRDKLALATLLTLATLLAYVPAMGGDWIWDDDMYVTENPNLSDLPGLARTWLVPSSTPQYYPLTHTTFWIEHHLWDEDPLGYHVVNVLLHATSAILLALVLETLLVPGAWLAGAIFALHPVAVESVAWVTERKNTLSTALYLGAALVFLRWALDEDEDRSSRRPWIALALFTGALLSKTMAASLPVTLALVLRWKRGRLPRREVPWLAAMLVVGAISGLFTVYLEKHHVGAGGRDFALTSVERGLLAGRVIVFYLGKLAWPSGLAFVYERWTIDASSLVSWLYPGAVAAAFVALAAFRRRIGWAPLVTLTIFVVTLFPALGFINVFPMRFSYVADHFQYLAMLAPIALFAAGATRAAPRLVSPLPARASAAVLLAALAVLTWRQGYTYSDPETLWRKTIALSPNAFMAQFNLATVLAETGRQEEALEHYEAALRAKPDFTEGLTNLANAYANRGRTEDAITLYRRALAIDPNFPLAQYNLAFALEETGRFDEAIAAYREAARIDPRFAAPHNNVAVLLFRRGEFAEAWREARRAEALGQAPHPDFLRALAEAMPEPRP